MSESEYSRIRKLYPKEDRYRKRKQQIISQKQLETIIQKASKNRHNYQACLNTTLLIFLSETGLRVSEACTLKVNDIFFSVDSQQPGTVQVHMGKGGKSRKVVLTQKAQKALKCYLNYRPKSSYETLFLGFSSKCGYQPLDRHAVARRFKHISEETSIPFTAHSLRHFRLTEWSKNPRLTLSHIQKLAGHSSVTITERYIHIQDEEAIYAAFE